jgi:hypothetical protein
MVAPVGAALLPSIAGWQVLAKTQDAEKTRYAKQPEVAREIEYFKANISKVKTPADLVKDRRLLGVVLGAYGLDGDINSQARVRKVLEGGVLDPKALANKLIDPRYKEMAGAFNFDLVENAKLEDPKFIQSIIDKYTTAKFEGTVGDSNPDLQKALYFKRKIASVNNWYEVLADKALFQVVKTTFGLPDAFSKIDVDKQKDVLESKIGLAKLKDPTQTDSFAKRFLAISGASQTSTAFSPALEILNGMAGGRSTSFATDTMGALLTAQGLL